MDSLLFLDVSEKVEMDYDWRSASLLIFVSLTKHITVVILPAPTRVTQAHTYTHNTHTYTHTEASTKTTPLKVHVNESADELRF